MDRVKYPLTSEAKGVAIALVEAWDKHHIEQSIELFEITAGSTNIRQFAQSFGWIESNNLVVPRLGVLRELAKYGLISLSEKLQPIFEDTTTLRLEITLLEELRNAVINDFSVSDYFLTVSAVGTIVLGNIEVRDHGNFQSSASIYGNISQNIDQVVSELNNILGPELLANQQDLRQAIETLRLDAQDSSETRLQKIGKIIEELGRCLGHVSDTYNVLQAILLLSNIIPIM